MFEFVCISRKFLLNRKSSFITSTVCKFLHIQISPFSSVSVLKDDGSQQLSFTVNYLIKRCGLSEKRAISASKFMKFETPDRADSVIAVFKKHGFTDSQVSDIVKNHPRILVCCPWKTLLPKIEFFQSLGFKDVEISRMLSSRGNLLSRSLEIQIIPSVKVLRDLFTSYEDLVCPIRRYPDILTRKFQRFMVANIKILREVGIPEPNILNLLKKQPRWLLTQSDVLQESAKKLEKMGLNPRYKSFAKCLWRMSSMNSLLWNRKMALYERWGCSEDQVLVAFKKHTCVMAVSEGKIMDVMDFLVDKMGYDPSFVLKAPVVVSQSLKKIIVPRCLVYQVLLAKGLMKKRLGLSRLLGCPEKRFLKRFVECYENEAPDLLKIYLENLKLSM